MNFGKQKWNKLAKFKFQYSLILKNQAVKASDAEKTMFKKECKRIMCGYNQIPRKKPIEVIHCWMLILFITSKYCKRKKFSRKIQ